MNQGIYEALINQVIQSRINDLDKNTYYIHQQPIDKEEAALMLSQYLSAVLKKALGLITKEGALEKQLTLANKIIFLIRDELDLQEFEEDLLDIEGKILKAIFSKINADFTDLGQHISRITPETRLIHSELFTGGNARTSLDVELRKEILSSNKIDLLVSFIKWSGIILISEALKEFTNKGGRLRLITTTYVGATDQKAVELLAGLKNTEVKVSYNTSNERVHAKAYLFYRDTGFHTAYIGSSNFSKSALTKGLEWNMKVTTKEIPHIIEKFQKTFDTYWQNPDFETFHKGHEEKLSVALKQGKLNGSQKINLSQFDIKPYPFQNEILEKLEVERSIHGRYRNLVVAATGTGKTVISAFDFKRFRSANPLAKLLFVAHRKEILQQAQFTFQGILKDANFGELWVDGIAPTKHNVLFASVQTLNNRIEALPLSVDYFDFIIIDEVHHIAASSYRPILQKFKPQILLGLTATPERMDGADILDDFCHRIAAEIRLPEALNKKLLTPFQYFGITDTVDLSGVSWTKGRYLPSELSKIYTSNDHRVSHIISNLEKYLLDPFDCRALGFCVTQEHAAFMAQKFNYVGLKADYLVSSRTENREQVRQKLITKEINYLFVVDIFNEGVDIPEIDTVLFLRPTESLTVFLQQLGRGLRLHEDKDCLMVLDFVGNARPEYDFEGRFRALVGKTKTSIKKEIETDFPHAPLGCAIVLEEKAKETILRNIQLATNPNRAQLIQKIQNFEHQYALPLTLENFTDVSHIPLAVIYKKGSWKRLCAAAGKIPYFDARNEKEIVTCILRKWLSTSSTSYFNFILQLARKGFDIDLDKMAENEKAMCLMLHYDVWQNAGGFDSLQESIRAIGTNPILVLEIIEVLEILIEEISFLEIEAQLPFEQPLKIHSRYTRDQIMAAFGLSTFHTKTSNREGVAENKALNVELLFVDLIKSEENFSPTTMYQDYAITEQLFHWQSQNKARPDKGKGLSYIRHLEEGKNILLFVREQKQDEFSNTIGYVFIGDAQLKDYSGSKPMNIQWELAEPLPHYLYNASAKFG
ncbi:DEAD/DEAH box helicase [Anditalea andensis]|uniref:Restriction endonuclease subunit R n=1 Tax=Anditalea andensis TaxID=1048983 RepID=A0A074KP09_9BACT|nr:DEAD/DEAH box helicase [Anditalea andensis]KEO71656.1 restriction endonuclease subunit R [Anditalea andensis]